MYLPIRIPLYYKTPHIHPVLVTAILVYRRALAPGQHFQLMQTNYFISYLGLESFNIHVRLQSIATGEVRWHGRTLCSRGAGYEMRCLFVSDRLKQGPNSWGQLTKPSRVALSQGNLWPLNNGAGVLANIVSVHLECLPSLSGRLCK